MNFKFIEHLNKLVYADVLITIIMSKLRMPMFLKVMRIAWSTLESLAEWNSLHPCEPIEDDVALTICGVQKDGGPSCFPNA